ncbi:Chaperone dnaJ 63 [Hyphodiscus hymeniophilus]|uniref:Chaperone dnaJ 63 n=1 Tax=Hyphodiscus hymeniophilus TaxID=353542 RepID=A0A9P6VFL3_9HELO|nr:Chaperone dnaJ 63 [Hyphodiscus hymeniophilus]
MAFDELPPDPYKLLGVAKDAKLPEIRSAHRKLVLKCHPDKVQDAALKAIKQDEFQKVQQAYELLSDDHRRLQYDEQVKLHALRKEMGRGSATPRSNPFEYEVKNAEPRSTTYTYTRPTPKSAPRETTKVYPQQQRPSSYEDVAYESVRHPKKSASYESADRDQKTKSRSREEERARDSRRHEEDERARAKWEKDSKRAAYGDKKKRSDKEKKRGVEEKHSSRAAYVEEDSSDDYRAERERAAKEKSRQERHRVEEDIRNRNEAARAEAAREAARNTENIRQAPLTPKWDDHKEYAAQYMQAARRKAVPAPAADDFHSRPLPRAESFAAPDMKFNIRYAVPPQPTAAYPLSDDEAPRRSSASRPSKRAPENPPTSRGKDVPKSSSKEKEREREREKEKKRSGRSQSRSRDYPHIVEPPSPPPLPKQKAPTLQTHSSAPPIIPGYTTRKEPDRAKTQDYPRSKDPSVPPLPRAATFQSGDRGPDRSTQRGSRLKKTVDYSSDSDSEAPVYTSHRHSHSPAPIRRREAPEPTRYIIDNGRSVPISTRGPHRSEMRGIDDEVPYVPRDRSESPHGTARHPRTGERPSIPRAGSGGTRQAPNRSNSQTYFSTPPTAPEPVIREARPKMPPRESNHTRGDPAPAGPYFEQVKYATPYRPEDVIYNNDYRRSSDPNHHPHAARDYAYASPPVRNERVYA